MKEDVYIQEWVQKYLDNELSETEKKEVEERMKTDEAFAEEVASYQTLLGGLEALGVESFQNRMNNWEARHQQASSGGKSPRQKRLVPFARYYGMAAVLLLLLIPLAYFMFFRTQQLSPEDLYAAYYAPYEEVIIDRDTGPGNKLERGMALYGQGKYEEASLLLNAYAEEMPDDTSLILYLGIIDLQKENFQGAMKHFSRAESDPLMQEQARWYKGLTYLKTKHFQNPEKFLRKLHKQKDLIIKRKKLLICLNNFTNPVPSYLFLLHTYMTSTFPSNRLVSLDVFRGMTIAGMIIVNDAGDWNHVYSPLRHANWHGITPTDLVFPLFPVYRRRFHYAGV